MKNGRVKIIVKKAVNNISSRLKTCPPLDLLS